MQMHYFLITLQSAKVWYTSFYASTSHLSSVSQCKTLLYYVQNFISHEQLGYVQHETTWRRSTAQKLQQFIPILSSHPILVNELSALKSKRTQSLIWIDIGRFDIEHDLMIVKSLEVFSTGKMGENLHWYLKSMLDQHFHIYLEFIELECGARFASFLMFYSHVTPHICSGPCVRITMFTIKEEAWAITTQAQGNQFKSKFWT